MGWAFHLSFSVSFGALIAKVNRVYRLMSNRAIRRFLIPTKEMLIWVGKIVMVDVVLLALWSVIDPSVPVDRPREESFPFVGPQPGDGIFEVFDTTCESASIFF